MKCPRCQAEVQADAKFCRYCGATLEKKEPSANRILRIYGYTEWYAITPDVEIYMNGNFIGSVAYQGVKEIVIGDDNYYFEFKLRLGGITRKCHCFVNNTFNGGLKITTNRFWGTINVEYTM